MSAVTASLCSTLLFVGLFVFVSADQKNITAQSGQNVTLTCRAPNNNIKAVEWSRTDLKPQYVLLYRDGHFEPGNQHPSFKNRVDLQDKKMKDGDVSLILKNVTTSVMNGTYECRVFMSSPNNEHICNISLTVVPPGQTGGHTEDGQEDGSVGLKVGLSVCAVLLVAAAVVGFFIYRKHKKVKKVNYESTCSSQS